MSQINAGQIQVRRGSFGDTTTTENDLIANQAIKPAIRSMLEIKNKRYLMTLLTSGAVGQWGINNTQSTKIPLVDKKKGIGNNAYRFDVIGRIEKAAVIRSQIGASGLDGSFSLLMNDDYLYVGQNVKFFSGKVARVMSANAGSSASGYVYNFKTVNGTSFTFSTDVSSTLTCFPFYTSYSEGSLRSDSRDKKPDSFINHMTIQRKTVAITGSAESDVLWYEYADGQKIGWLYWKVDQMKAQLSAEQERQTLFGVSSMKNTDGSLRSESALGNDPESGLPIIMGDGYEEQISGTNTAVGSGTNGEATEDDFEDMMKLLQMSSNRIDGLTWVCITGTDGCANAQRKMINLAGNQNTTFFQNVNQSTQAGGARVDVGYNFQSFNINGNKVLFIVHPMFDDLLAFPARGNDGRSLMSSTYFFMGIDNNSPTMEILAKEANGINRSYVEAEYIGLTGKKGLVQSEVDANKIACLMETVFCIYDPQTCGIIYKAS